LKGGRGKGEKVGKGNPEKGPPGERGTGVTLSLPQKKKGTTGLGSQKRGRKKGALSLSFATLELRGLENQRSPQGRRKSLLFLF